MSTAASPGPAPVTLVVGPEELLAERGVEGVLRTVRDTADDEVEVRRLDAVGLSPGALAELVSPSLFGERTVVVLRAVQEAPDDLSAALIRYVGSPSDSAYLVLVHTGSAKGRRLLDAARKAGAVEVSAAELKTRRDRLRFVQAELRALRRRADEDAVEALVEAVGSNLRALASACAQLAADTEGVVDLEVVRRYYEGRAEVSGFAVADRALEGDIAEALVQLRWALHAGVDPVPIVTALAAGLRSLVKMASAPRGLRPPDLARQVGLPPWKVEVVRRQLRGWTGDGIASALVAVAAADAQVKGAGTDPVYALERALVSIGQARG